MKDINDSLPLISASFLVMGALKLIFYYNFFGIDIISYIDLSEIFTLSFSFLVNSSFIALAFLVLFFPIVTDGMIKGIADKKLGAVVWLTIIACVMYFYFTTYDVFGKYTVDFRISYDTFGLFAIVLFNAIFASKILASIQAKALHYFTYDVSANIASAAILIVSVSALCVLQSRDSARDILLKKYPGHVEIKLDSVIIKSNNDYRFIGKTRSYAFFYDTKNNIADVYSIDGENNRKISFPNSPPSLIIGGLKTVPDKK